MTTQRPSRVETHGVLLCVRVPDSQGLMMAAITRMMLMTVIMSMAEVVKTGKMKNLIFEMGPFKLSFLPSPLPPFSPLTITNNFKLHYVP